MSAASRASQARRILNRHRRQTLGPDARLFLLKTEGGTRSYKTLAELVESWSVGGSRESGSAIFRVARTDAEFNANARDASHAVVRGSTNEALNDQLFEIDKNTTTAAGADCLWRITSRQSGKRFVEEAGA